MRAHTYLIIHTFTQNFAIKRNIKLTINNIYVMRQKLLSMLTFFCLMAGSAWAQTSFVQGNLKYTITGSNTVSVAKDGVHSLSGALTIPSSVTYNGTTYTVTAVSDYGFESLTITAVTIPGTVTNLGERAFGDCHKLAKITFEESTQPLTLVVGYYGSFQYCDADKEVIVNRNLTPSENSCPFYANVTSAVVGGKATTVTNNLFQGQGKMTSIRIGNSVTSIGNYAFYDCGDGSGEVEMTLTLSDNLTTIGENAFGSCEALKSLTLPSSLKLIGGGAFSYASIASIVIPESVDSIGEQAFENCKKLTSIRIKDSEKPLRMREGYYRPFHYCDAPKAVYLGRNLILTEDGTPFETAVTSVEIGDKVTTINPALFRWCNNLSSVSIGSGVTTIGESAFYDSGNADEVDEMIVTIGKNVTNIGENAFYNCDKLKAITLPASVKTVESNAFANTGLTDITIPATVDSLGQRAFGECGNLTNIRIENKAAALKLWNGYYGTFAYSDAEKTVYVGRDLQLNDNTTVFGANPTSVTFGDYVTTINPNMFYDNGKLASVTIGKGVKTIGIQAFYNCGNDESVSDLTVKMGENITQISENAFYYCKKLKSITLPSSLKVIESSAFSNTGLTSISIPASVDSLGTRAFGECFNLTSIRIEDSATPLKMWNGYYGTFAYSDAEKTVYVGRDLQLNDNTTVFGNPTSAVFGNYVTNINPRMFNDNSTLASVTIGKGVKAIGYEAFRNCGNGENVSKLTVTMGDNITQIANDAFYYCKKLTSVTLPSSLKLIEANAFSNTGLTSITIPASVDSLGTRTFGECGNLTSIRIEDNATPLKLWNGYYGTFAYTDAEKTVYVGRDLQYEEQGSSPFSNITSATIGPKVTSLNPNELRSDILMSVQVPWQTPIAIQENVFSDNTYQNGTLLVPGGTKQAYAEAEGWKKFFTVDVWSVIVKLTATGHGSIATEYGTAEAGKTIEFNQPKDEPIVFTLTAENGYKLTAFTDNGTGVSPLPQLGTAQTRAISEGEEYVTLAATFTPISYKLTYDLAGGKLASGATNPSTYTIETATFTLNNPTRDYYDFTGWTGTDLSAPTQTVTIAKGSTGDRTYTANWIEKSYTVSVSGAGVTASNLTPKYGESVVITIADDPDRTLVSLVVNGVDVTAQVVDGQYVIQNVNSNVTVEATFKSTKEFITLTGEYATFSCPQDLDFTGSDLRAYIASGYNKATNQVLLTRVKDVPAGTGVFLVGQPGETYKIPYSTTSSIYMNFFVANLQKSTVSATTGNFSNYTFGEQAGDPGFYPVSGSTTLLAQTAYLQLPTNFVAPGVKVSVIFEEDIIDGIEDFRISNEDAEIYDLAGRRLHKAQKGIYIINGKKTLVK